MLPTATVDIGTTSVKLCVFDAAGTPLITERHSTPTVRDESGEVYDVPALQHVVLNFLTGLDDDVRATLQRLTIAGVGESGGLVRPDLSLASPMILWHDHRGADRLADLGEHERALVYRVTGLPVNANYGLSKVAWAVDHGGPGAVGALWLNIAEYLAAWMTGERWSERSLASRTMALDLTTQSWSPEVCALLGVDVRAFPPLRRASDGVPVRPAWAQQANLDPELMVHVAGHDHMVGAVGAGLHGNELLNSTGTTEGLLFLQDHPHLDPEAQQAKLANGLACQGTGFTLFASIPTGGAAFATLQTLLGLSADSLAAHIRRSHARYLAGDVDLARIPLILPQFRGSAPPEKSPAARGIVAGIQSDTTTQDIVFGCFLGLARQFLDVLALFRTPVDRIKVIGPATRNDLWSQLKADLLRTPLSVSDFPEVVSRGAQALASSTPLDWASCRPRDVLVDDHRSALLTRWAENTSPQWEYLKGMPT
jgi:sugar (pentulose or hexulose) kinase